MPIEFEVQSPLKVLAQIPDSAASTIVLCHGITADHTEDRSTNKPGIFDLIVELLAELRIATVRFDFRGHGQSPDLPNGFTITSQYADLEYVAGLVEQLDAPMVGGVIGCSFGACAAATAVRRSLFPDLKALLLLNPVLSPYRTMFDPGTSWSRQTLGPGSIPVLEKGGDVLLDGAFEIKPAFLADALSFQQLSPEDLDVPTLIAHGDADSYVSIEESQTFAQAVDLASLVRIYGSEHGFGEIADREFVAKLTALFADRYVGVDGR